MDEAERLPGLVDPAGVDGAKEVLDAMPFPVLLIGEDYRVEWGNRSANELYEGRGEHCYQLSHGHERPCDQHGEACPMSSALVQLRPSTVFHAHGTLNHSELFKVIAIPAAGRKILEPHLPLDEAVTRDDSPACTRGPSGSRASSGSWPCSSGLPSPLAC
jgi:hypothetical protein